MKEISTDKNISLEETIKEAVSFYLSSNITIDKDSKIQDALSIIGKYNSGRKDISMKHDKKGILPVTEKVAEEIVSLPIFPDLEDVEVDYVIKSIRKFFN